MELNFSPADMNWLAQAAAIVVYVGLGSLWFGPFFGKAWAVEMERDHLSEDAKNRELPRGILLTVIGGFLLSFALRFVLAAFTPGSWLPGSGELAWSDAWLGGFWAWLGYFVPLQLGRVAWEGRSWRLFGINSSFDFVALSGMALILGLWT